MTPYADFLAHKSLLCPSSGIEVKAAELHPGLFPFQRDLVKWALAKGRSALFASTGLGKTFMQLEWARLASMRTLILAPLAVAQQTVREGACWGRTVTYAHDQGEAAPIGTTITNYERLDRFDPARFGAVVLDECFLAGTLVDTPEGARPIETIRTGNVVLNALGGGMVKATAIRSAKRLVVVHSKGCSTVCSENHPWLTLRGWVRAQELREGDQLVSQRAAVRMVQGQFYDGAGADLQTFLQSLLFGEMADVAARACRQSAYAPGGSKARREAPALVGVRIAGRTSRTGPYCGTEPDEQSGDTSQDIGSLEGNRPSSSATGRQRPGSNGSAGPTLGSSWRRVGDGIRGLTRAAHRWISDSLQSGYRSSRAKDRGRSRWAEPLLTTGSGPEAGREAAVSRVDRVEVYESSDPRFDAYRGRDGRVLLYDLEVIGHPSYSVNGHLVHNSSILKSYTGKTRTALIEAFSRTPMRLCCTATPAPNDIAEIANHAEFLGVMTRAEMLAAFFVHDDNGWRLKGHAREPFYRWLASWGMSLLKPSNLGYSDEGYDLPPLTIEPVFVATDYVPEGRLFPDRLQGITERAAVRRDTLDERVEAAVGMIQGAPREPWIAWCGLNDEATALAQWIPDSVNVEGSQSADEKVKRIEQFLSGEKRVLITKCQVCGFGLNLQHCARMVFVGLGDSYEQYFQALRRCWRFGQQREVKAYVVLSEPEEVIYRNVLAKEREAEKLSAELITNAAEYERSELAAGMARSDYRAEQELLLPRWL